MFRSARAPLVDEDPHQADLRNKSTSPTTTANTAITRKPVGAKPPPPLKNGGLVFTQPQAQDSQHACPHCGGSGSRSASRPIGLGINTQADDGTRRRIEDLEAEVRRLTGKASSAADKLADYEDELRRLKADPHTAAQSNPPNMTTNSQEPTHQQTSQQPHANVRSVQNQQQQESMNPQYPSDAPARSASIATHQQSKQPPPSLGRSLTTTRITNFLSSRRGSPATPPTIPEPNSTTSEPADLTAKLALEQNLRQVAERKLHQTNQELEELSASLFQQANEMVAAERKARMESEAKAEERDKISARRTKSMEDQIRKLESRIKVLEQRDFDKIKRLERLESAMKRAGRVRTLLVDPKFGIAPDG